MEEKTSGERKKLSLSLDGKLTLNKSVTSSKTSSSVTTNSRTGRSTVQVEVKRTKRSLMRSSSTLNEIISEKLKVENISGLSAKEIHDRSKILQEGLAKTAAEAETLAAKKFEHAKAEEARVAAGLRWPLLQLQT